MVSNEIRNCAVALGAIMHQINDEQAAMLRVIKVNLMAAADEAEELETNMVFEPTCCCIGPNTRTR